LVNVLPLVAILNVPLVSVTDVVVNTEEPIVSVDPKFRVRPTIDIAPAPVMVKFEAVPAPTTTAPVSVTVMPEETVIDAVRPLFIFIVLNEFAGALLTFILTPLAITAASPAVKPG